MRQATRREMLETRPSGATGLATLLASLTIMLASPAFAQVGLPVAWQFATVDDGATLRFTITADARIEDVEATLRRAADRRTATASAATLDAGESLTLSVPQASRTTTYTLRIEGDYAGERDVLEDRFEVEVLAPMEFSLDESTLDLDARRFEMTMTQPAGAVEITVRGDQGQLLSERTIQFEGEPPGTPLEVRWTQPPGNVLTLDVKAISESGAWAAKQYIPWSVEVDVDDVNFPTASAEIPQDEQQKLVEGYERIMETARRVSEWVEVKLYIAGHTDTVGSAADNLRLSRERAQSLARFMRERGVDFPIYYQGFGESALAVPTADNVDEPENRRAVYILSVNTPPTSAQLPRSSWQLLE